MKLCLGISAVVTLLATVNLWAQTGSMPGSGDQMTTPAPASGQAFGTEVASQERSNYLSAGVVLMGAYSNDVYANANGHLESDLNYSVMPTFNWAETTSRLKWQVGYAPGFTGYQHETSLNQSSQNANLNLQYRLSPHVTFTAYDRLQKSSSVFNQPDPTSTIVVSGGIQQPNFSVIASNAEMLMNSGSVGMSYQFALNAMIGASGSFSNLHYPDASQVTGLSDSESQAGTVFLSLRASQVHYFGATYSYARLLSYPFGTSDETQTQAMMLFYSFSPNKRLSASVFGGPQYADSAPTAFPGQITTPAIRTWSPAVGGSLSWIGRISGVALSYAHIISDGGGLGGAVHMDNASLSVRQRISKTLNGSLVAAYTENKTLAGALPFTTNGHTIQGTASLQQALGKSLSAAIGYTRLYQSYSGVPVINSAPTINREFISLSYQFSRPIGQ